MDHLIARKQRLFTNIIIFLSIAIPVLVGILLFTSKPDLAHSLNIKVLPAFHAVINGITAILLMLALFFIRMKNILAHKTTMLIALLLSVIFLMSYVTYHSLSEPTTFGGVGFLRYFYYFILITHIILAAIIVPFVLFTFLRAFTGKFEAHKKLARWTLPLWLYVALSGVLVYILISPYY